MSDIELMPIRCGKCGRFMGYEAITIGVIFLWCKKCKDWVMVAQGVDVSLEDPEIRSKIFKDEGNAPPD